MDNNEELEKTKKVFSLEEISNLEKQALNEIEKTSEINQNNEDNKEDNNEEPKKSKKKLSKKALIIIIIASIIFVATIGVLSYLFFFKKDNKPKEEQSVIVKKDNYRYENGKLIFVDDKKEIGHYNCKNKNNNTCYLANYSNNEDNFFVPKNLYEDLSDVLEESDFINNQYAFIIDSKDKKPEIIIYDFVNEMKVATVSAIKYYGVEDLVIVKSNKNKYGLYRLEPTGFKELIDCVYDYLGMITLNKDNDQMLVAKSDTKWSLISYNNDTISKNYDLEIKDYNSEYVVIGNDESNYVVDYKGNYVFKESFSYVKLFDEYLITIKDLDLNVYDYETNKYNGDAITLVKNTYIPENIYDKDLKLIKTNQAFDATLIDNTLTITIKDTVDKNIKINLYEGKISKNLKYLNYFDGKLYIYNDEEKTDLLGTYQCTNKNVISSLDSKLTNCNIAKDTIYEKNDMTNYSNETPGIIPVINKTFIFVTDKSSTSNTNSVKLYNLKTNKIVGTYESVSTYSFTGLDELSFINQNDDIEVIARLSKDNKMGLIKINGSEVKSGIKFQYLSLEKMGKYFLGKTSDSKYVLIYNNEATSQSNEFNGQIKGYNEKYLKVFQNNKYHIYDYEGNKISNVNYKYIDLYDDYYLGVDDGNNLSVYDYNNDQIISESIKLYSNKYTDSVNPAFKVDLTSGILTISIDKDNNYLDYCYDIHTGNRVEG